MHNLKWVWLLLTVGLLSVVGAAQAAQRSVPRVVITEVLYNAPGAEDVQEWIEIANVGTAAALLDGVKLGDEELLGSGEGMLRFPEGAVLEPGQVIVIGQSAQGFADLYGRFPDYEITDTSPDVPDLTRYARWATGEIALANAGDEVLLLGPDDQILDAINYGEAITYFFPAIGGVFEGQSIERVPADCDTDTATDWKPQDTPTPGTITLEGDCDPPPIDEMEVLPPIGEIQGGGDVSPYVNDAVSFRGVVTGIFEDQNASGVIYYTLFVQDAPGTEDGDPATSDGVAVFLGRQQPAVQVGDLVRVVGRMTEFYGLTEVEDDDLQIYLEDTAVALPTPVPIDPPADLEAQAAYFEPLEGMLVSIDGAARVVGPTYNGCGFAAVAPGAEPGVRRSEDAPIGEIVPVLNDSDVACDDFPDVKTGDRISGLAGPLVYNFDQFKIVVQDPVSLQIEPALLEPAPTPPPLESEAFSVASYNLYDYFDLNDDTGSDAEPKPTVEELAVKREKLAHAIGVTLGCPTLLGVQEVENAPLLEELAQETAVYCDFTYAVSHLESVDGRGIDVALLSDPRRVEVDSVALRQTCAPIETGIYDDSVDCAIGQDPLFSRPPLQADVRVDGQPVTLFVNHFKSKRGGAAETEPRRLAQAQHVNSLVAQLLNTDPQTAAIVLGDFNDYDQSPAVRALTASGSLVSALESVPDAQRYSYVFSGAPQLIDGIFVSPALAERIVTALVAHVNADYPSAWAEDNGPERIAFKSSDHDMPLVVFAAIAAEEAPLTPTVASAEIAASEATAVPAATPTTPPESLEQAGLPGWIPLAAGIAAAGVAAAGVFIWLDRRRRPS